MIKYFTAEIKGMWPKFCILLVPYQISSIKSTCPKLKLKVCSQISCIKGILPNFAL